MRRARVSTEFNLDLIPVMSLIVHIVPMLLLSVRFATLSTLGTDGPVLPTRPAPGQEELDAQEQKVVSVRITPEGFVVGGAGLTDPRLPCRGPCGPDSYDLVALRSAMEAAKDRLPAERRVVIVPAAEVPFEVLVAVLDTTSGIGRGAARRELFPVPLLAESPPAAATP